MAENKPEEKKEKKHRIRRFFKSTFNFTKWMNLDRIKASNQSLKDLIISFFVLKKETQKEDFNLAVQRMNLSSEELNFRQRQFLFFAGMMLLLALGVFAYAIYLFSIKGFLGGMVALAVTLVALALTFRYHFWYFQIKKRKLGCTFSEWLKEGLSIMFSHSNQMPQVKK